MIKKFTSVLLTVVAFLFMLPLMALEAFGVVVLQAPLVGSKKRVARRKGDDNGGVSLAKRRVWAAAPMRSSNWAELLLPTIYEFYDIGRMLRPTLRESMYRVIDSTRDREENVGYGGIGVDAWDVYEASGNKGTVDFDKGYTATYTHQEYPVRFEVERKLMDDDQYGVIGERARKIGISASQKMERDAASTFNNAFSTSFTGPDNKPLCSTTHPRNPNKSGSLVNAGTSALTADAVETTRVAMEQTVDDAGTILGMMPDTILVPPALRNTALEIANSPLDPESANNAINAEAGTYNVVSWSYLTDSNNWFMIDSIWMRESLKWYNRVNLEFETVHSTTTETVFEAYMRYSFGWDDWRWVYGHEVS